MDSEDELEQQGDEAGGNALDALEQALDGYGDDGLLPPPAEGDGYYGDEPLPPHEADEYGDAPDEMQYDFPGDARAGDPPPNLGASLGSQAGGMCAASTSSLPEEIDVTTHGLIDETVQRLTFVHGVLGVMIIDADGKIVHATMPPEEAAQLTGPTMQMLQRARATCKNLDDELQMLCVRTRKYEMLLCAEADAKFAICVLQDPQPDTAETSLVFETKAAKSVLKGANIARTEAGVVF